MTPVLLLVLAACPPMGPRPSITGTVSIAADGAVSGDFEVVTDAPDQLHVPFGADLQRASCGDYEVARVRYESARPKRAPDGSLFLIGLGMAWAPHPGRFHDMQVWLRLPVGWAGRLSGERPSEPPRCDPTGCVQGPFRGTGQPGAMLAAAPERLRRARGEVEVFVAPEHEPALERLLDTAVAMDAAFTRRFGPRATRGLTVFEVETGGGFSVHGMIAMSSGAIAAFAEGDAEAPLLAHELCHHWFGSIASGGPWLTEGLCRHCELWWVQRTRTPTAAAAFGERLARQSDEARPGLNLREMTSAAPSWRDYEAVAYSRGALVAERWREALGVERWDAALRAHLREHRGQRVELDQFLALTASVAPEADIEGLAAKWLDVDVDPRTGEPRPRRITLPNRLAGFLAIVVFLLTLALLRTARARAASAIALLGVGVALWRGPGWVFEVHAALVVAAWLAPGLWSRFGRGARRRARP